MKVKNYEIGSSLRQRIANAKGRFSTQFMSEDQRKTNLSKKKAVEDSVKMEGYEVSFKKKTVKNDNETQQPMSGYSEFWLG